MRRVVYVSRSLIDAHPTLVDAMVEAASARNAAAGITGMLWFDGGSFAQVLEGEYDRVGETYARISIDPRHTDLQVIVDREVRGRAFGQWGMIQPDDGAESMQATAFLVGLSLSGRGRAAQRLHDVVIACDV